MALDPASLNIRVNCICPGYVISPALIAFAATSAVPFEQLERETSKEIIPGRFGKPEEIAKCVVFLCSDEASYVTGAYLMADGGLRAL
jgi:NAD(P)-dependent dehydrogenase (short-subunit alcohol dehydrogenase family)